MAAAPHASRLVALLGPTNTGKTYFAVERLVAHRSGMIGFPLRLLARENYDRIVALRGERQVALITGEEKIMPPEARYFVCTVESMPLSRPVEMLAVDEIQLAADPERGHVFTDRLLHARGISETLFLGAETIRPLLQRLLPKAEFVTRPRFSRLSYAGPKRIARLPRRSAVVAFSANDVYAIAELIRRQRGGAAVVMGALSPRTRNAQVALYQSGDVDYLVATDAIGMGLNMDLDHAALAALVKFDGVRHRRLRPDEIGQIAGRAGRHMNDGTFGTTGEAPPLEPDVIERIESHAFERIEAAYWRNADLDFASLDRLLASLAVPPALPGLMRAPEAVDAATLRALAANDGVRRLAASRDGVERLWQACQIPEFHKTLSDAHTRFVAQIFAHLMGPEGRIPEDWLRRNIERLDRRDGDIETLMGRLAQIRTWTYVAHRGDWLDDSAHWQSRSRDVEDRLSDALHSALMQRFVDRRTAVLLRRLKDRDDLLAAVTPSGEMVVEGEYVGRVEGFRFAPDVTATAEETKALLRAARPVLRGEIGRRLWQIESDGDEAFTLSPEGFVLWRGVAVARLAAGRHILSPQIDVLAAELLEPAERDRIAACLVRWLEKTLHHQLTPLFRARAAELRGAARGLLYQLCESLGTVVGREARATIRALSAEDRQGLARLGVRLGPVAAFLAGLNTPATTGLRALLWQVHYGRPRDGRPRASAPAPGQVALAVGEGADRSFFLALGFVNLGPVALRADIANRLAAALHRLTRKGTASLPPTLLSGAGLRTADAPLVLRALGFHLERNAEGVPAVARLRRSGPRRGNRARAAAPRAHAVKGRARPS